MVHSPEDRRRPSLEHEGIRSMWNSLAASDVGPAALSAWLLEAERVVGELEQRAASSEHDAKNLIGIALVAGGLAWGGSGTQAEFEGRFKKMLTAAAERDHSVDVTVEAKLRAALKPALFGRSYRGITFDGPPVVVRGALAFALGEVAHELARNARKHGSLRLGSDIRLDLTWREIGKSGLSLEWREVNPTPIAKPTSVGGGLGFLKNLGKRGFDARTAIEWLDFGISVKVDFEEGCRSDTTRPRVLILDDDELVRGGFEVVFEMAGYAPRPSPNYEDALASILAEPPHAALLDANLGQKDDRAFAGTLAVADALLQLGVPFAFLSGSSKPASIPGHDDAPWYVKGITGSEAVDMVRKLLASAKTPGGTI